MRAGAPASGARRLGRGAAAFGAAAALVEELVELGLVAGEAEPVEEVAELLLLLLEAAKRLHPVLVEGAVAGAAGRLPFPGAAPAAARGAAAPRLSRVAPARAALLLPASHAS